VQKISKDTRKKVQFSPLNVTQGVKKFPQSLDHKGPDRPLIPIQNKSNINSNQARNPKRLMPIDIHQDKFEGKGDSQFLPMQVNQNVVDKLPDSPRKGSMHQKRTTVTKVTNPRAGKGRDSSAIAQDLLDSSHTLTLREAVHISPRLWKDLLSALRQEYEPSAPTQEKTGLMSGMISRDEPSDSDSSEIVDDNDKLETFCATPAVLDPEFPEA
jgi:hypothetical protein